MEKTEKRDLDQYEPGVLFFIAIGFVATFIQGYLDGFDHWLFIVMLTFHTVGLIVVGALLWYATRLLKRYELRDAMDKLEKAHENHSPVAQ